jgi:undecaprenyl-diphosphatase
MPVLNRDAASSLLDAVFPTLTNLHQIKAFLVLVGIACIWLAVRRPSSRPIILAVLLAVAVSDLTCSKVAKKIFHRERPCTVVQGSGERSFKEVRMVEGTNCPGSPSFPSNHASNMMAVASAVIVATRRRNKVLERLTSRWIWAWLALPLVIGYTRIYLGFHYPTDVAGGWIWGALCGWLIASIVFRFVKVPTTYDAGSAEPAAEESTSSVT